MFNSFLKPNGAFVLVFGAVIACESVCGVYFKSFLPCRQEGTFFEHPLCLLICLSDLTVCGVCGSIHRNRKLGYAYVVKLKFMVKYAWNLLFWCERCLISEWFDIAYLVNHSWFIRFMAYSIFTSFWQISLYPKFWCAFFSILCLERFQ